MDALAQDIRIALRRLFHSRGFAALAIGILALGIGANTAVFTIINAVSIRPLPFAAPERLVDLYEHNPVEVCTGCSVGTSYPNYLDWQRTARSFAAMAAHDERPVSITLADGAQKRRAAFVSAELFPLLGVMPVRGRFFTRDEEQSNAHVALIGDRVAQASFGVDANPVGQTIRVDGETVEIVGVMPERFVFPEHADLWLPLAPSARVAARNDRTIGVVARLSDGVTMSQAAAEISAVGTQMAVLHPAEQNGWNAFLVSLHEDLTKDYSSESGLLLGAVACVLLIACANLANLMLARTMSRRSELAVRAALGATRLQLARQLLVETLIVSLSGGAVGLVVAMWGTELLRSLGGDALPRWIQYDMDWRVFTFALALSLVAGLAFGVLPARLASRASVHDILKDGGRAAGARSTTGGRGGTRARDVLVVLQVSVAFVLVIAAGLFTRTMLKSRSLDMGYPMANLMRADIDATGARFQDGPSLASFTNQLLAEVRRGAGVSSAALSGSHFLNWPGTPAQTIVIDDVPAERSATALHRVSTITPAYFETMGLPVVAGRAFTNTDVAGSMPVVVVSNTLSRSLWGEKPALGKHIRIGAVNWTVVGVVGDMRESPLGAGYSPLMYVPLEQLPVRQPAGQPLTLTLRTASAATNVVSLVRTATRNVDPSVSTESVMSVDAFLRQWQAPLRILAIMASALGGFACLLAALGIYGVIAYIVAQRTHEIGIRMALGASVRDVMRLVMRHGAVLACVGAAFGLIGSLAFRNVLGYLLFGVKPTDPLVYVVAGIGFMGVALVAAWIPAQRATRVNPTEALRAE